MNSKNVTISKSESNLLDRFIEKFSERKKSGISSAKIARPKNKSIHFVLDKDESFIIKENVSRRQDLAFQATKSSEKIFFKNNIFSNVEESASIPTMSIDKTNESYEGFFYDIIQEMAKRSLTSIIDYISNSENAPTIKSSTNDFDFIGKKESDVTFSSLNTPFSTIRAPYSTSLVEVSELNSGKYFATYNEICPTASGNFDQCSFSEESYYHVNISALDKSCEEIGVFDPCFSGNIKSYEQTEVSKETYPKTKKLSPELISINKDIELSTEKPSKPQSSEKQKEMTSSEKLERRYYNPLFKTEIYTNAQSIPCPDTSGFFKEPSQKMDYPFFVKESSLSNTLDDINTYDLSPSKPTYSESIYTMVAPELVESSSSSMYKTQPSTSSEYFVPILQHPACIRPDIPKPSTKNEAKENYYSLSILIPDQFSDLLPIGPCNKKVIYSKPTLKLTEEEEYLFYCGQPKVTESQLLLNVLQNKEDKPKQMYPIPKCHLALLQTETDKDFEDVAFKSYSDIALFEGESASSVFFSERLGAFNLALRNCKDLICPTKDGQYINSWLLTEVSHWDTESEKMVVLTENCLLIAKYDFINHRIKYFHKIKLAQINEVTMGDMRYPRTSFMPYIHDCFQYLSENVVKNLSTLVRRGYKPLKRISPIAVCVKWGSMTPGWYHHLWNWNPWTHAPWITLISHPLVYRHQDLDTTTPEKKPDIKTLKKDTLCAAMMGGGGEDQNKGKKSEVPFKEYLNKNTYDVSHFHSVLESHLQERYNKRNNIKFLQQPIIIENYIGLLSTLHNMFSLGYNKSRGRFSY